MADLDQDVTKNVNDNSEKDSNRISVKSFYPAIEEYIKKYYIEPIESFGNLSVPSLGSKAKSTTKRTLRKTRDVFSVKRADLREEKQEICSLEKEEAVKMRANTNDLDQLNQLDLYVLLKILQKNWNDLREKNMSTFFRMNWDLVNDLLDVRNRFAHFTEESYSNIQAKNDIFTIADYLAAVGESQDKVKAIKLEGISLLRM